jgi:hypothetical protein
MHLNIQMLNSVWAQMTPLNAPLVHLSTANAPHTQILYYLEGGFVTDEFITKHED